MSVRQRASTHCRLSVSFTLRARSGHQTSLSTPQSLAFTFLPLDSLRPPRFSYASRLDPRFSFQSSCQQFKAFALLGIPVSNPLSLVIHPEIQQHNAPVLNSPTPSSIGSPFITELQTATKVHQGSSRHRPLTQLSGASPPTYSFMLLSVVPSSTDMFSAQVHVSIPATMLGTALSFRHELFHADDVGLRHNLIDNVGLPTLH
eukprot:Gb_03555 [translate_table: standard]